jgi:hypothetical protein
MSESAIKRYTNGDICWIGSPFAEKRTEFVLYTNHERALKERDERIERLEQAARKNINAEDRWTLAHDAGDMNLANDILHEIQDSFDDMRAALTEKLRERDELREENERNLAAVMTLGQECADLMNQNVALREALENVLLVCKDQNVNQLPPAFAIARALIAALDKEGT